MDGEEKEEKKNESNYSRGAKRQNQHTQFFQLNERISNRGKNPSSVSKKNMGQCVPHKLPFNLELRRKFLNKRSCKPRCCPREFVTASFSKFELLYAAACWFASTDWDAQLFAACHEDVAKRMFDAPVVYCRAQCLHLVCSKNSPPGNQSAVV